VSTRIVGNRRGESCLENIREFVAQASSGISPGQLAVGR
jgi:hypothetical protein